MGGFHTVTLPDGRSVDFPSTMADTEINAAIQKIVGGPTKRETPVAPIGEGGLPLDVAARHMRSRQGKNIPSDWAEPETGLTGAWERAGTGLSGMGKEIFTPNLSGIQVPPVPGAAYAKNLFNKFISQPSEALSKRASETTGAESLGYTAASKIPVFGPMAAQAGEVLGRRDWGGLVDAAMAISGAKGIGAVDSGLLTKISDAQKILNRHLAVDQGKVRVVNEMVRKPLAMLDSKLSTEIGQSVNSVLGADEADMVAKGNTGGFVDVSKAAQQARSVTGQTMKGLAEGPESQIIRAESRPIIPLREAKSFTTDVGTQAAALRRSGRFREAAALDSLYDGLRNATQERADTLGGQHSKLWRHYIDETRNYKNMQGGLLGELVDEPNHASALGKLIDPKRATEASEITEALKKYGVDSSTFDKAKELGVNLDKYSQEAKMNFFGKIRSIIKHPWTAGPAAVGAAVAGHALGIPGLGFVLPIIVAGKVAGIMDTAEMINLLKEVQKAAPSSEAGRVTPPLEGPISKPFPPSSGGSPTPTAPAPSSPSPPKFHKSSLGDVATSQTSTADMIQALRTENTHMKDRMRVAGGTSVFPDEEVQAAEKRMQENADLIKELQGKLKRRRGHAAD